MTPLFGMGGDKISDEEEQPELPPLRAFAVQTPEDKAITLNAHSYDVLGNGALVFAEFIDLGGGKAAIVVVEAFATGQWKRFKEVPTATVQNTSKTVN